MYALSVTRVKKTVDGYGSGSTACVLPADDKSNDTQRVEWHTSSKEGARGGPVPAPQVRNSTLVMLIVFWRGGGMEAECVMVERV